jgi:hypothetical protein
VLLLLLLLLLLVLPQWQPPKIVCAHTELCDG